MALISFAVTAKLICVFVFAYAKIRFSHVAAHIDGKFSSRHVWGNNADPNQTAPLSADPNQTAPRGAV